MPTIVMLLGLSLSGCLAMDPIMTTHTGQANAKKESKDTFWKQIKTDDTPQKHLSIAKDYRSDAKNYRLLAKDHQRRKAAYQSYNDKSWEQTVSKDTAEFMVIHCQRLVEKYTELADEMENIAKKHEEMAENVAERRKKMLRNKVYY